VGRGSSPDNPEGGVNMGRLSEAFKKCSWFWNDVRIYIEHPENQRKVVEALKKRLQERGLDTTVKCLDVLTKKYPYSIVLRIDPEKVKVSLRSAVTFPTDMFKMWMEPGMLLEVHPQKPTGETIVALPEGKRKKKLEFGMEVYREVHKKLEEAEDAMVCFMYDVLGEELIEYWAFDIPEVEEFWRLVKDECGERLLSEKDLGFRRRR